ncbi:MAG: FMN-binding negative transcriptional regulator [Steroidobacteraceae bacterium]
MPSGRFEPRAHSDVLQLIAEYPLALLVSQDFQVSALPLIVDEASQDGVRSLLGHIAKRNPQLPALRERPRALALFNGPQGYVSGRMVSKPGWGPTWNYAIVRFEVDIEFCESGTDDAVRRLAAHLERDAKPAWQVEQMGERYAQLREHIIGFRAHVRGAQARFKLGQDEDASTFAEIVAGFQGMALADWMAGQRVD